MTDTPLQFLVALYSILFFTLYLYLVCTRVHVEHVPFYRLMLPQGLWPLTVFPHEISVFISAIVSNNFMPRKLLLGQLAGL